MNSISISKDQSLLCKIANVSLVIHRDFYPVVSLRDKFISFFKPRKKITETILKDISFDVHRGDRLGIIGFNGAGKTTLCKVVSGMFKPTTGEVEVTKSLRTVFYNGAALYPNLSGRENIELLVGLFYPNEIGNRVLVESIISFSELGHLIDAPFITYSNGMKSRLYLSVALQRSAELLVFDESFEGADYFFSQKAMAQARSLMTPETASIVVTHSFESLREICNRVIVLNKGSICYQGDIETGIKEFKRLGNME